MGLSFHHIGMSQIQKSQIKTETKRSERNSKFLESYGRRFLGKRAMVDGGEKGEKGQGRTDGRGKSES